MYEETRGEQQSSSKNGTIVRFFRKLLKLWWLPVLCGVLFTGGGYAVARVTDIPMYTSEISFMISINTTDQNGNMGFDNNTFTLGRNLAETYRYLLTSNNFVSQVIEDAGIQSNVSTVKKYVAVRQATDTSILILSVTTEDPQLSYSLANAYQGVAVEEMPKYFGTDAKPVFIKVIDSPKVANTRNLSSNNFLLPLLGLLIGLVLSFVAVWIIMMFSHTVYNENDVYSEINAKLLAKVPLIKKRSRMKKGDSSMLINEKSDFAYAEAYKSLRLKVENLQATRNMHRFLVTSTVANEGKSTVASNLAIMLANKGKKVLLVDCDLRRPTIHLLFRNSEANQLLGISDFLAKKLAFNEVIKYNVKYDLCVAYCGTKTDAAQNLLNSDSMERFMREAEQFFEYIIIDTPPVRVVSDAIAMLPYTDASILVIRQEVCAIEMINRAIDDLSAEGTPLVGCVFNSHERSNRLFGYGYRYSGYYGYGRSSVLPVGPGGENSLDAKGGSGLDV